MSNPGHIGFGRNL